MVDFVRTHFIPKDDELFEGEQFRVTFDCPGPCGFALGSNGAIRISGEFEGQVLKFVCAHGVEVSMMMDDDPRVRS